MAAIIIYKKDLQIFEKHNQNKHRRKIWKHFYSIFRASSEDPIPCFLRKAITFIERDGLDAEGLYRVPGNRAHVDLLFQRFDEDPKVDIDDLDIAVNAVATAVKDFFFKRLPPILEEEHMSELETISCKFYVQKRFWLRVEKKIL